MTKIDVSGYPTDMAGPMQVVSGPMDQEKVRYEAPPAERMEADMSRFLNLA